MGSRIVAFGRLSILSVLVCGLASSRSTASPRSQAAIPTIPNLEAWWPFEESTGITANDLTGHGHTGTHSSGVSIDGVNHSPQPTVNNLRSVTLSGGTGGVNVVPAASLNFTSGPGFTLAAWVRPTSAPAHQMGIIEKFSDSGSGFIDGYFLRLGTVGSPTVTGHYLKFNLGDGAAQNEAAEPGVALPQNAWTHVAGVFDGTSMQIYKNGVLAGSALSGPPSAGTGAPNIGGDTPHLFAGNIDDARIYNRPLTMTEVGILVSGQPAPTGVSAAPAAAQITVSWTAAASATGYEVYRSLSPGGPFVPIGSSATTSFVDSGVANPTTYYYQVTAVSVVESAPAGPASAIPDPTAPKTHKSGNNHNIGHRCGCGSTAPGTLEWGGLAALLLVLSGLARRR